MHKGERQRIKKKNHLHNEISGVLILLAPHPFFLREEILLIIFKEGSTKAESELWTPRALNVIRLLWSARSPPLFFPSLSLFSSRARLLSAGALWAHHALPLWTDKIHFCVHSHTNTHTAAVTARLWIYNRKIFLKTLCLFFTNPLNVINNQTSKQEWSDWACPNILMSSLDWQPSITMAEHCL